ncbi:XRE family transcriptional regulator [Chryseobacterium nepalense]|uniref:LexA family transcriptional regulator n=1 Tax=Chryseobacterium nepalense TaxID=1854498 RepID=A0ABY4K8I0_9FLAO|nr:LexA family transcriptional regulator [Chryseobacterium nepalense]UPQ77073.1 LexA family transcriptional regulator [Chryseobacterium nepalense]
MSIFSENIRYLRSKLGVSQQSVADSINITRGRYAKYEDDANSPSPEILVSISRYYKVSIDLLLTVDLKKYSIDDILNLPDNRIVLPIKVGKTGENKIEIVPHKGKMGYLTGYNDPEYIEALQHMSLPFLRNGKYRAFPVEGDSMPPYNDGTYIIGKYIESKDYLKKGKSYMFVTRDGIVYKRFGKLNNSGTFVSSDNVFYEPYEIEWKDILEIWEFAGSVNTKELEIPSNDFEMIKKMFKVLHNDIKSLKDS